MTLKLAHFFREFCNCCPDLAQMLSFFRQIPSRLQEIQLRLRGMNSVSLGIDCGKAILLPGQMPLRPLKTCYRLPEIANGSSLSLAILGASGELFPDGCQIVPAGHLTVNFRRDISICGRSMVQEQIP
jgi:hypothetical protein